MTRQIYSLRTPPLLAATIAISICCPDCGARRNFAIAEVLNQLHQREASFVRIDTDCRGCGHRFQVSLGWAEKNDGWTTRPFDEAITTEEGAATIEDAMSLRAP